MTNEEHLDLLKQGVHTWNKWREKNCEIQPDLSGANLIWVNRSGANPIRANLHRADFQQANLSKADLSGADLTRTSLYKTNFSEANLQEANLSYANLSEANLQGARLSKAKLFGAHLYKTDFSKANLSEVDFTIARLIETNFKEANLTGSQVYGISAWGVELEGANQSNLVITPAGEPTITVDNLEVAQFIYLLLNNQKIRDVIDTIGKKGVLILGRFTNGRKAVLDAIREKLRSLDYVPIVFDFERPKDRDFTETVMTLAGMCRFIIADITNPKSSPLELQTTVPNYMIPFVPIIQEGEKPFSMFRDLQGKFDWVLDTLVYDSVPNLMSGMEKAIIKPAQEKHDELMARKAEKLQTRHIKDHL